MQFIKIKKTKRTTYILGILLKLNVIAGWSELQDSHVPSYLVYCNGSNHKQILTFLRSTRRLTIKVKFLKKIASKSFASNIYLTTSKGVISLDMAIKYNVGGYLLFSLV